MQVRLRLPHHNYMEVVQTNLTPAMRGILVDWLVEVAEEYELSSETLFLAVNYLDRFAATCPVDRRKFQLVGVACMLIASKYEGIFAPAVDEFVYISANTYSREEVPSNLEIFICPARDLCFKSRPRSDTSERNDLTTSPHRSC